MPRKIRNWAAARLDRNMDDLVVKKLGQIAKQQEYVLHLVLEQESGEIRKKIKGFEEYAQEQLKVTAINIATRVVELGKKRLNEDSIPGQHPVTWSGSSANSLKVGESPGEVTVYTDGSGQIEEMNERRGGTKPPSLKVIENWVNSKPGFVLETGNVEIEPIRKRPTRGKPGAFIKNKPLVKKLRTPSSTAIAAFPKAQEGALVSKVFRDPRTIALYKIAKHVWKKRFQKQYPKGTARYDFWGDLLISQNNVIRLVITEELRKLERGILRRRLYNPAGQTIK